VEDVICRHIEIVESSTHIGTCRLCGQQAQYDGDERKIESLLKRGEINGRQTMIRPPFVEQKKPKREEKAREKQSPAPSSLPETTYADRPEQVKAPAPKPRKKSKKQKRQAKYLEENKEAIIQDYHALPLRKFFRKWHISSQKWQELKQLWKLEPKGHGNRYTYPAAETKPQVREPFKTGPMNKRTGTRAIWRF